MVLGETLKECERYVKISFAGSLNDDVIETTFYDDGNYLTDLDITGTGVDPDTIIFPGFNEAENSITLNNPRVNTDLLDAKRYVMITFDGEKGSVEKENLNYAFSCSGYVCGINMAPFTGMKYIDGIYEDNDGGDIVDLDTSKVISANYAFRNSGITSFSIQRFPKLKASDSIKNVKSIIDKCAKLNDIFVDGFNTEDMADTIVNAAKYSNLKEFSADSIDHIGILDMQNTVSLDRFVYSGLGLSEFKNIPDLSNVLSFKLLSDHISGIEDFTIGKPNGPLVALDLKMPCVKTLKVMSGALQKFSGHMENMTKATLETPTLEKLDLSGTEKKKSKLNNLDISKCLGLTYLNLSYTQIKSLDLTSYVNIPYVEFESMTTKVIDKGWLARYCEKLETVKILDKQSHGVNNNLAFDVNTLQGCTSLKTVSVLRSSEEDKNEGNEIHYSTASFMSPVTFSDEITYKGKTLEEWLDTGGGGGGIVTRQVTQAQYDALPSSKLTDGIMYEITDDMENASPDSFYSTDEKVIGTWINGKSIYRKVVKGKFADSITQPVMSVYDISVSDLNIDTPLKAYGFWYEANGNCASIPRTWVNGSDNISVNISLTRNYVEFCTNRSIMADLEAYAIIEYTKK